MPKHTAPLSALLLAIAALAACSPTHVEREVVVVPAPAGSTPTVVR